MKWSETQSFFLFFPKKQHFFQKVMSILYSENENFSWFFRISDVVKWSETQSLFCFFAKKQHFFQKSQLEGRRTKTEGFRAKKWLSIAFPSKNGGRIAVQKSQLEGRRTKTEGSRAKKWLSIAFSSKNGGRIAVHKKPVRRS